MSYLRTRAVVGNLIVLLGCVLWALPSWAADDKPKKADKLEEQLNREIEQVQKVAEDNPCRTYFLAAIRDPKVRSLFLQNLRNQCYVLHDICCLQTPSIPGRAYILFNFDCAPHCACLLDPQFLVIVDKVNQKVVQIVDPYHGPTEPCISIRSAAKPEEVEHAGLPCASDEGCEKFGVAAYHAIFDGRQVWVFASGVHPMSGFKNCLQPGPEDVIPPIYEFKITPPQAGATVITPFMVCNKFTIEKPPRSVTVRDARGEHAVPVINP